MELSPFTSRNGGVVSEEGIAPAPTVFKWLVTMSASAFVTPPSLLTSYGLVWF